MKVNFMIIGAMKCGTSTLSNILSMHPDISFSRPKEPDFFCDIHWKKKLDEYSKYFSHKKARLYGEGSTSYTKILSRRATIWKNLFEYNPELKLIYLVRHPVDRTVSQYLHGYQRGFYDYNFQLALSKTEIISVSQYYLQIMPFIELFGRNRVLILKFEDFIHNQPETLKKVAGFLDIDPGPFKEIENMNRNVIGERMVMTVRQEAFHKKYLLPLKPFLPGKLYYLLRNRMILSNQKRVMNFRFRMREEDEFKILHFTRPDMIKLQEIVSFDISDYLVPSLSGKYRPEKAIFPFKKI